MIASRIYYYVVCDNCDIRADYGGEAEAWRTPDRALNQLPAYWTTNGLRQHCPDCPALHDDRQEVPC